MRTLCVQLGMQSANESSTLRYVTMMVVIAAWTIQQHTVRIALETAADVMRLDIPIAQVNIYLANRFL